MTSRYAAQPCAAPAVARALAPAPAGTVLADCARGSVADWIDFAPTMGHKTAPPRPPVCPP